MKGFRRPEDKRDRRGLGGPRSRPQCRRLEIDAFVFSAERDMSRDETGLDGIEQTAQGIQFSTDGPWNVQTELDAGNGHGDDAIDSFCKPNSAWKTARRR